MATSPLAEEARRLRQLLKDPDFRRQEGRALAEGPHLLKEALTAGSARAVWATSAAMEHAGALGLDAALSKAGLRPKPLEESRLRALSDTREPQGWLCEVERVSVPRAADADLFLALDTLQDPGNLGTLLRLAWAAKACVLLGPGCADPWSPKVLRAGAGAQFHVPLAESEDLSRDLRELAARGVRLYGTAPRAQADYLSADAKGPLCWVLGSEGQGLAKELSALCSQQFRIAYPGSAESLNVAVSGAILLFDVLRKRG